MLPDDGLSPVTSVRSRVRRIGWTGTLATACLAAGCSTAASHGSQAAARPKVIAPAVLPDVERVPAPELRGTLISGQGVDPAAVRGRITVVTVCTSPVSACADQLTLIAQLPSEPGGYGRTAAGPDMTPIGLVPIASAQAIRTSARDQASFPQTLGYAAGSLSSVWKVGSGKVTTLVVDTQGRIAARFADGVSRTDLLDAIARISAGPSGQTDPNPVSRAATITCDGTALHPSDVSAPGTAEKGDSEASVLLRRYLAGALPEGAGGPVPADGWLQVADKKDRLVFAHRTGSLGVDTLLVLDVQDGRITKTRVTTCSTVLSADGTPSEPVTDATVSGATVVLRWMNERCDGRTALGDRVRRIEVQETATSVHLMLVTEQNPAGRPAASLPGYYCVSDGTTESRSTVRLDALLGDRTLYDDSSLAPIPVTIQR